MRHFYLLTFTFIFIASFALTFTTNPFLTNKVISNSDALNQTNSNLAPLPVLTGSNPPPPLSSLAALVVDIDSGVTLYEKNSEGLLLPASTTKIITSMVALDHYDLDQVLKVGNIRVGGQKMRLVAGEEIKVRDLLYGLLIFSANDAAEVLAENYCTPRGFNELGLCGRDVYVAAMNLKAEELSLENTHFSNPTGLDGVGHVTSARDLVRVSNEAMKNPFFREVVSTKERQVRSVDGKVLHKLVNLNELVGEVEGVLGVKTGWTEEARENLVTYVERNGSKVMMVVLGSQDRFGETKDLINWIFANYEWKGLKSPY